MKNKRHILFASIVIATMMVAPAFAEGPLTPKGPGGTSPMVLSAAAFSSDGDQPAGYYTPGQFISGGAGVTMRAPVYLPAGAYLTDISAVVQDGHPSYDAHIYLHETQFGSFGADTEIVHLESSGSSSTLQYPADYNLDMACDPANKMYWVEAFLPADDIKLYSVHFFFADKVLFADGFESGTTGRWSTVISAKSLTVDAPTQVVEKPDEAERVIPTWMQIEDPEAEEALNLAINGKSFGSPLVVPGAAFKSIGGIEFDDYYISGLYGFVYARPDERATMIAPLNLPDGANISFFMIFYKDSNPGSNIDYSLSRMNTWDGSREDLLDEHTLGADSDIRSVTHTSGDLTDSVVDNSHYSYWITIEVEGYDFGDDYWHEVHSIVVLYTLP